MANEFKVKNGLIVVGDLTTSGTITINGALAATQSWVTSQAYLTSSSLTSYATQTYVNNAVAALVDSAPGTLDTLNELAAALGDDASFSTTVTNSIAAKLPLAGGTLTGALLMPTGVPAAGNSQPTALSYGLLQGWGNFVIAADTDGSQSEFAIITAGYGVASATAANGLAIGFNTLTWKNNTIWHAGNLTNLNQLSNGPGYITSYTETDTLNSVTGRGASTANLITVGGATISNNLITTNGIADPAYTRITNPGGGINVGNSPVSAAIKIALPANGSFTNIMLSFTVHIFDYALGRTRTLKIAGYTYYNQDWYNMSVYQSGGELIENINVRFGVEGGRNCVWIGETNTYWSYPNIFITDVQCGHSQTANLTSGWTISLATSFGTVQSTLVAYTNITTKDIGGTTNYVSKFTGAKTLGNSLIFDNGTNIGIGTTSPGYKLEVEGSIGVKRIGVAATSTLDMEGNFNFNANSGYSHVFKQAGSEIVRILPSGNVGIGTASPGGKLDVVPASQNGINVARAGGYPSIYSSNDFVFETDSIFYFGVYTPRLFSVNGSFYTTAAGSVGIGTSSPSYKLHVNGTAYINETLYVNQATTIEDTFTVKTQNGSYNVAVIDYSGTAGGRIKVYTDGILRSQIGSYYGDDTFFNAGYGGNVGIGTSSPSTKLNIYSDTTADGILVDILSRPRITLRDRGNSDTIIGTGDYGLDDFFIDTYSGNALAIKGSTRNVGIGTTSPNEKLHVAGNINAYVNGGIDAGLFASTSAGSTTIALRSNGITHFNGGSVGIGTFSPTDSLSVQGNTNLGNSYGSTTSSTYTTRVSGYAMRYDASNRYGNYGVLILNADSGWTASARRFMLTSGLDVNKFAIIRSVDATTDPSFGDGGAISSGTADFVINSNGLVGIGITSPTEKLHVNGDTRIVGNTYVGGIINAYQGDASIWVPNLGQAFTIKQTTGNVGIGTTSPGRKFVVTGAANDEWIATFTNTGTTPYGVYIDTSANASTTYSFATYTNTGTGFFIRNNGLVGIGTTSPSFKLHVEGDTYVNGVLRVSSANPLYFNDYGGGWYMADSTWIRTYNSKSVWTAGGLLGSEGGLTVGYGGTTPPSGGAIIAGNVGIGTSSPNGKLHITAGGGDGSAILRITGTASDAFNWASSTLYSNLTVGETAIHQIGKAESQYNAGHYGYRHTADGSSSNMLTMGMFQADYLVNILGNGNVGIGTTSPSYKLDVSGNSRTTGIHYVDTYLVTPYIYGGGPITMGNDVTITSATAWNASAARLNVGGTGDGRIQVRHIYGKSSASIAADHLWLQYQNTGSHVQIGDSGGGNHLYVSGNIYMGGYFGGNLVATQSWVSSQNYLTSYSETDTLASVTGRGASTSTAVTFSGGATITGLTIAKSAGVSTITFPAGTNDPAFISHTESTANNAIMRFSVGDDNDTIDYFAFGNTGNPDAFRINANGTISTGTWQGTAIADAYISSAATWNTAYGWGNHAGLYLGINSKSTDSELLDGIDSSGFVRQLSDTNSPDYQNPSSRRVDPNVLNPTNEHYAITTFGNGSNVTGQLATHFQTGNLYSRGYNSTWSAWRRYWNDTDFTSTNVSNWNTAYSWGNHASASYATTSYVTTQINNLIAGAPGALDTLDELAAALGDDASFATTVTNSIAAKLPLAGGTMTGDLVIGVGAATSSSQPFGDFSQLRFDNLHSDTSRGPNKIVMHDNGAAWIGGFGLHGDTVSYYTGGHHRWYKSNSQVSFTQVMQLDASGNLTIAGSLTESSSLKLKENIETSEGNLEKVVNLRPVTYNKIGSQTKELGLIAEEVATVYPEFVQYDENGEPIGVNYSRLTAALIGAVKELTNQVQELNKKING